MSRPLAPSRIWRWIVKQVIARSPSGRAVVTKYSVSRTEADSIRKSARAAATSLTKGQRSTIAQAKARGSGTSRAVSH